MELSLSLNIANRSGMAGVRDPSPDEFDLQDEDGTNDLYDDDETNILFT